MQQHADVKKIRKMVLEAHRAGKTMVFVKQWDAEGQYMLNEKTPMWMCITPAGHLSTFTNTLVWGGDLAEGGKYEITFS
jgi:hypothetical protein